MKRLLILLLALCGGAQAANHYIRDGGTASTGGTGACTNWNTANACDALPATLVSGDTYYFADGTYSSWSGGGGAIEVPVTIKKCSASDHGTETGYVATYCDGQAVYSGQFNLGGGASGTIIDGAYRNETDWGDTNAYGFRSNGVYSNRLSSGACADNITVKYLNVGLTDNTTVGGSVEDQPIYLGGFVSSGSQM